jgi:hypothetical protein
MEFLGVARASTAVGRVPKLSYHNYYYYRFIFMAYVNG